MSLLPSSRITPDQQQAITKAYEQNALIVGRMGSGKTLIAASAATELLGDGELRRVLILSTPKIANTVWCQEFAKWEHLAHIRIVAATGTPEQRRQAFRSDAQIVVATFNVLPWIKQNALFDSFDGLIVDESTKLKTPGGEQFKSLRNALKRFRWRLALTGTPVSEDFMGLYAQMLVVDPAPLGSRFDAFRERYFVPTDFKRYNWAMKPGADAQIMERVAPYIHAVPDYRHTLPPITYKTHPITMPENLAAYYDKMRSDMVTDDAVSQTEAVLIQKLAQIACGFVYDTEGEPRRISHYRVEALQALRGTIPGNVVICYWYQADLDALLRALPGAVALTPSKLSQQVAAWNRGEIRTLLIHPRSAGHGLQLEQGGHHMIWFQPYWSNDLWEQTNARLWRTGQTHPVTIHTLIAQDTIDEAIVAKLEGKAVFDSIFHQHLRGQ